MPLSWNEIKGRALRFSREWADEANEHAEAKSFWDDFFNIFGVSRRRALLWCRTNNFPVQALSPAAADPKFKKGAQDS